MITGTSNGRGDIVLFLPLPYKLSQNQSGTSLASTFLFGVLGKGPNLEEWGDSTNKRTKKDCFWESNVIMLVAWFRYSHSLLCLSMWLSPKDLERKIKLRGEDFC